MTPASAPQSLRVWVTRPAEQAAPWVQGLRQEGIDAHALPLIEIAPAPNRQALQAHVQDWQSGQYDVLMFVSANAVAHFAAACAAPLPPRGQAWGTGPGTAAALQAAGWPAARIVIPPSAAAQWDSEALWATVAPHWQAGTRVLIVRGADAQGQQAGRDWLAQQLLDHGAHLNQCVAYVRRAPDWSAAQTEQVRQALAAPGAWLFSSSEAAVHLQHKLPDLPAAGQSWALATHPRIAQRLQQLGWPRVQTVPAELLGQARSIKSLA